MKDRVLVLLFRGENQFWYLLRCSSSNRFSVGAFAEPFTAENWTLQETMCCFRFVLLIGKKKDKPRLQNGILEPLKVLSCKHPGHFYGVQGWRSGESARVPPMCPGFDSRTRRHMWVEFVVGPLPCSLLRVLQFFPLLKNQHFQIPIRSGLFSSTLSWASGSGDRASTPCVSICVRKGIQGCTHYAGVILSMRVKQRN